MFPLGHNSAIGAQTSNNATGEGITLIFMQIEHYLATFKVHFTLTLVHGTTSKQ